MTLKQLQERLGLRYQSAVLATALVFGLNGHVQARDFRTDFKTGDLVASAATSGGCPTFEALVQFLGAVAQNRPARDIAIANHCTQIPANTTIKVIDRMPGNIMRVEPADAPGENPLFVYEGGFKKQSTPASARSARPINRGDAYIQTRQYFLSLGFKPVPTRETDEQKCGYRPEVCKAYPETESCSGTGIAACKFNWVAPSGEKISVVTSGEELAYLKVYTTEVSKR
ncbi:hypothetical protein [Roseomonas gilardii]|uniref:hypothetical protein n=1 Tax=Roseomonas gilardii TaxID=257708 RepID=UPI0011A596B3|nr:hypothetical protein [Roseomonas gilardii]